MNIKKSNNTEQLFTPNKILKRIKDQSIGLDVKVEEVFKKAIQGVVEGMTTKEIDNLVAISAADLIPEHPDYSYLASRIIITRQGKIIGKNPKETDFLFDFFGIRSFFHKYSLRNDRGEPLELPHMMYERVAKCFANDKDEEKEFYHYLSNRLYTGGTPILTNAGTDRKSYISCNLTSLIEDSTAGILNTIDDVSNASRDGAGIGLHIHNLRSEKSLVSSFKGAAGGVVRFADMVQSHMRFFKQGNRSGSAALYLGVWHRDIIEFLSLRLPTGDEKLRTRDLFTAVCIPDLFMEKLVAGETVWYVFCPNDIVKAGKKPLHDTWGDEFKNLYAEYVELGLGTPIQIRELWDLLIRAEVEGGVPYTFFWDNANRNNHQDNIGVITGSNLCIEITEVTKAGYTAQCCLGSINLETNLTLDQIKESTMSLTKFLNRVIDKNHWSTAGAGVAGLDQRALAIGVSGMANHLAIKKINYEDSVDIQEEIIKTIYNAAISKSHILAVEEGIELPCWEDSVYDRGGSQHTLEFKNHKVANSLFVGLMPTASTSALVGVNESFEPFESNLFVRSIDNGEFIMINKHLVKDLQELGLWDKEIIEDLKYYEGSVQQLNIPDDIKERYKTVWEMRPRAIIDIAIARQKWIDQSQSLNMYYADPKSNTISSALIHAWRGGLKTGSYYTKVKSKLEKPKRLGQEKKTSTTLSSGWTIDCFGCST